MKKVILLILFFSIFINLSVLKADSSTKVSISSSLIKELNNKNEGEIEVVVKLENFFKTKHLIKDRNNKFIKKLSKKIDVVYVSTTSPFVIIRGTSDEISKVISLDEVESVDLNYKDLTIDGGFEFEEPPGGGGTPDPIVLEHFETLEIYDVKETYDLSGSGIKVGILENGVVSSTGTMIGRVLAKETDSFVSDHATAVATVAAGTNGIADGAYIVSAGIMNTDSETEQYTFAKFLSAVDFLVNQDVDIINASISITGVEEVEYSNESLLIDFVITVYDIPFIVSAGNWREDNPTLIADSLLVLSYNCISVGATSIDGIYYANYSRYIDVDGFYQTPTISAPGGTQTDFWIPGAPGNYEYVNGTSFAAPMITGSLALLMEEFPILKSNPGLVNAVVTGSPNLGNWGEIDTDGYSDIAGAGLFNLLNAYQILDDNTYINYNFDSSTDSIQFDISNFLGHLYVFSHAYLYPETSIAYESSTKPQVNSNINVLDGNQHLEYDIPTFNDRNKNRYFINFDRGDIITLYLEVDHMGSPSTNINGAFVWREIN